MLVFFQPKKKTSGRDLGGWNSEYGIVNVMSVYTNTQTHISTKITGESYIICPSFGCGSTSLRHIHHSQVGSEAFPFKKKCSTQPKVRIDLLHYPIGISHHIVRERLGCSITETKRIGHLGSMLRFSEGGWISRAIVYEMGGFFFPIQKFYWFPTSTKKPCPMDFWRDLYFSIKPIHDLW